MGDTPLPTTRGFHDRIVAVFDFDRTLSPGTIDALLAALGIDDSMAWRRERLAPMVADGWDEIPAKAWLLARTAEECGRPLTRDFLREVAAGIDAYSGVEAALERFRALGAEASEGGAVELYILSSGFVDLIDPAPIARVFDDVWGSSLHWDDDGRLAGVKRSIIHSEKARYLLALAKGLDLEGANAPQDVYQPRMTADWHVPLDQMLYVGDGASDLAAFRLVEDAGGLAIAVDHSDAGERWQAAPHLFESARPETLAPPDFGDGAKLHQALGLAARLLGARTALRRLGRDA